MYTYREMTTDDIDATFQVRITAKENVVTLQELEEDYKLTPETLAAAMGESLKGWVCECNGQVIGFSMGDADAGELSVISILPEHEGHGIGKKLLGMVESWLKEIGHKEIWLVTTPNPGFRAYNLYKSMGWIATGEIVDEEEKFIKIIH